MTRARALRFLVVSGPTREPLDPVRYLSNYSTGTMGKKLVQAARRRGHRVTWIRCPEDAETARDLLAKLKPILSRHDILVMAAAVCDVRPATVAAGKMKKERLASIRLVRNPDVLAELAKKKRPGQVFLGFALESSALRPNALRKLRSKSLEAILVQRVTMNQSPFGTNPVQACLLKKPNKCIDLGRVSKDRVASLMIGVAEQLKMAPERPKNR